MAKFYSLLIFSFLLFNNQSEAGNGTPNSTTGSPRTFDKTLMLRVKQEFRSQLSRNSFQHPKAQAFLNLLGIDRFEVKFPKRQVPKNPFYFTGERIPDMTLIYQLQYQANVPVKEAARLAMNTGLFEYAEPKYIRETSFVPNDPRISQQYYLDSIQAFQAWDITKGDTTVVIAICDSGVKLDHEDLVSQIKVDTADPINGIDDDNDGKIDNNRGWDFCGPTFNINYAGDNNATITQSGASHGTHVAGISAGKAMNAKGIAGVGYDCKIMPLKCAPDDGGQSIYFGYEAIEYAATHGAAVVNCSWGGAGGYSTFEQEVIADAALTFNCLVVAAAGNDNSPALFYPAYYKHVLAVSATGASNRRASFTNYSYNVRVAAPGVGIMSTYFPNTYQNSDGTSMASPVVAGLAGLVKARFPFLTADQIGQRIRVTSDNVYQIPGNNASSFYGKLGKGIVNAYRAVLEQTPGINNLRVRVTDGNNDIFQPGDSLYITADFVNYLQASSPNLKVKFSVVTSATSTYITPNSSTTDVILGEMTTNEIKDNNNQPFKIYLKPTLPTDRSIDIRMYYSDGAYYDFDHYTILLNPTYINVEKNNISTTLTSRARIGFNDDGSTQGLGFQHKKRQTLYELGLMSGTSATKIASTVRNTTSGTSTVHDDDYKPILLIKEVTPPMLAQFEYLNSYTDFGAAAAASNVEIVQKDYVFTTPGDSNYVIVDYLVKNKGTVPLTNFYLGYFGDFDISASGQQDKASWSNAEKLGYIYNSNVDGLYAGVSVLGNVTPNYYAIDNDATAIDSFGVYDGFSDVEKFNGLSSGLYRRHAGVTVPKDVSMVVGSGPYSIAAGDTIHIGFALVAGENLTDIQNAANNAQNQWPNIITSSKEFTTGKHKLKVFPNPSQNEIFIEGFGHTGDIVITNTKGQKMTCKFSATEQLGRVDISSLLPGIYYLKTVNGTATKFTKL